LIPIPFSTSEVEGVDGILANGIVSIEAPSPKDDNN
jgi:hypothetical protein